MIFDLIRAFLELLENGLVVCDTDQVYEDAESCMMMEREDKFEI